MDLFRRPFPWIRQHDAMQCGVASLAMICRHYGRAYSLPFLDSLLDLQPQGVSMLGLSETAKHLGFDTLCVKTSLDKLIEDVDLPAILHWEKNHFVVLYRISHGGKRFHISDPAKGKVVLNRKEFEEGWLSTEDNDMQKGILMMLEPTEAFGKMENPQTNGESSRRDFRFITGYLIKYRRYFIQILLGLLLGALLQLAMPFLTQGIVDKGIHNSDISIIWLIVVGEFAIIIGRTATDFIRRWLVLHISMRVNISLVSDFIIKLLKLPMRFFDTRKLGDIMQRMGDHQRVQTFLTTQTLEVAFTSISLVVFGIVLLIYDPLIFATFCGFSILYGIWILAFMHRRKVLDYEIFSAQGANNDKTYQLINSMQEIKLQNCRRRRRWEWEDAQADLFTVQMKSLRLQQSQEAGAIFINEIKNIIITVLSATAVIHGHITLGAMLAIQYIIGQLNSPLDRIMGFVYSLQDVRISLERINEVHDAEEEENEGQNECRLDDAPDIEFDNVRFRYDRHSPIDIIKKISFKIPAGKTTAIVGASGSGKSTLLKLILGYYPPLGGEIRLCGRNLSEYSVDSWRERCGVVMQEGVIFAETIARNIAVDDNDIDYDRMREAAEIACIRDFIEGLPLKYDTIVGKGGNGLSLGQKQRLLIARAVYRNPSCIILDEATNSLDATNEREIVKHLSEFYKGRTVIIVAHRLSTVRDADNIIVLENGNIAEQGAHQELISNKATYYNLIRNQLELGN